MHDLMTKVAGYLTRMRRRRAWKKIVSVMACLVVFCTTYALILPALTLERSATASDASRKENNGTLLGNAAGMAVTASNAIGKPVWFYQDGNIAVQVVLEDWDTVPEDALLAVRPVTRLATDSNAELLATDSDADELATDSNAMYVDADWKTQAEAATGREAKQIEFYDISFYTPDGEYIPVEDTATVTMRFVGDGSFADEDDVAVLHYHGDGEEPVVLDEMEKRSEEDGATAFTFRTEGFSVFAVMTLGDTWGEDTSFDLIYGEDYRITCYVVDGAGEAVKGHYPDVQMDEGTRYIFGKKGTAADAEDAAVDMVAPEIEGYTFKGASGLTGTTADGTEKAWDDQVASIAANGYRDAFNGAADGFRFYTKEPLEETQQLSWGNGVYELSLTYTENPDDFDGRTFAIVNQADEVAYALTAETTTVNNVDGLKSQEVTITEEEGETKISEDVTAWTFHKQEDDTYTISTKVEGEDGEKEIMYLNLCEESPAENGCGSLTLTSEAAEATALTVTSLDDGSVTLASGNSNLNLDVDVKDFWSYNSTENLYSQQTLYEIEAYALDDYSGEWVISGLYSGQRYAMTATESGDAYLSAKAITVSEVDGTPTTTTDGATRWTFEKQADGTYYISSHEKYLNIGTDGSLKLTTTPQSITIADGAAAGEVYLSNGNYRVGVYRDQTGDWYNPTYTYQFRSMSSTTNASLTLGKKINPYTVVEDAVDHPSSIINLFDYWVTPNRYDVDTNTPLAQENGDAANQTYYLNAGINNGRTLKFTSRGVGTRGQDINIWTGSKTPKSGIVKNLLEGGYPVVDSSNESLEYLFNPSLETAYRTAYSNVSGLLQVNTQGYYEYDSEDNFAEFDEENKQFTLYTVGGVNSSGGGYDGDTLNGQFFPFNAMDDVKSESSNSSALNHYFGLTLTTRFIQQYNGYTTSTQNQPTTFEFSGDDDVWIFIDDVLVADLGGIHNMASVSIDFVTGNIVINEDTSNVTTLRDAYEKAYADLGESIDEDEWSGNTFANNTYHTLKFFYLERGGTDSNMKLQYNLAEIPVTAIYKVNQYGDALAGAKFAVYSADENYEYDPNTDLVYEGETDATGTMEFTDENGMPYTLNEIKTLFGNYFVLVETERPANHSLVSNEIYLYITEVNGTELLLCGNIYESGAYSSATLLVEAPAQLVPVDPTKNRVNYYSWTNNEIRVNGTLFAVVLKYTGTPSGTELVKQENWNPVYGSSKKGYSLYLSAGTSNTDEFIDAVIATAKLAAQNGEVCFGVNNGGLQLHMENLPGDIKTYYHMLDADSKGDTQYTVGYYYTTASSLEDADSTNTFRIDAETTDTSNAFAREFGATIEVPNLINRLFAQKLDVDGNLVNGAVFGLYEVYEDASRIYYVADDGTRIYLESDSDGDGMGSAEVRGDTGYEYRVASDGTITVSKESGTTYTITALMTDTTVSAAEQDPDYGSGEDGTASFRGLSNGTYYLREIGVPAGYQLNPTEVMVLVADDAVYANAGTLEDGVTVARGPGYLVATLDKFASQGDIDNTLTWVYERMRISPENTYNTFKAYDGGAGTSWPYLVENHSDETTNDVDAAKTTYLVYAPDNSQATLFNYTINRDRYNDLDDEQIDALQRRLYTPVGWTYYELYQDGEYGEDQVAKSGAGYEMLYEKDEDGQVTNPQEIAHLFSRSTYVQVTDQKADSSLVIRKTVEDAPADAVDAMYTFRVELYDAEKNPLYGEYSYTITETGDDGSSTKIDEGTIVISAPAEGDNIEWPTIQLADKQAAEIKNLPAGSQYSVTEVINGYTGYIVSSVRDKGKNSVDVNDDETTDDDTTGDETTDDDTTDGDTAVEKETMTGEREFGATAYGTLYWSVSTDATGTQTADTVSTVDYTNTYLPEITLHKVESGSSDDNPISLAGAEFVLYKVDENGENLYYSYGDGTREWISDDSWVNGEVPENCKLVTLEDGKAFIYGLENGTYWLEEIAAPAGYHPLAEKIEIVVAEGKLTTPTGGYGTTGITIGADGLTLTVPNSTGKKLPETGGSGTNGYQYGGLLFLAAAACGYMLKRRREGRAA